MKTFREFQKKATKTAVYPQIGTYPVGLMYAALGLTGEAGEVAEEVKKSWRNNGEMTEERRNNIFEELGDVMWYVAQVASELDLDLEAIAQCNLKKLAKRAEKAEIEVHA